MGDEDFFDELYRLWAQTSLSRTAYWMPEEYKDGTGRFRLYALEPSTDTKKVVACELSDEDAEFIAGLHGALPDLVRLLHEYNDRTERAECDRDAREALIYELESENAELRNSIPPWEHHDVHE